MSGSADLASQLDWRQDNLKGIVIRVKVELADHTSTQENHDALSTAYTL